MKTFSNELMNFLNVKNRKKSSHAWMSGWRCSKLLTDSVPAILSGPAGQAAALHASSLSELARFGVLAWARLASSSQASRSIVGVAIEEVVALLAAGSAISGGATADFDVMDESS